MKMTHPNETRVNWNFGYNLSNHVQNKTIMMEQVLVVQFFAIFEENLISLLDGRLCNDFKSPTAAEKRVNISFILVFG